MKTQVMKKTVTVEVECCVDGEALGDLKKKFVSAEKIKDPEGIAGVFVIRLLEFEQSFSEPLMYNAYVTLKQLEE